MNGRTVFKSLGVILIFFLLSTSRMPICFGTASPAHNEVATELPLIDKNRLKINYCISTEFSNLKNSLKLSITSYSIKIQ